MLIPFSLVHQLTATYRRSDPDCGKQAPFASARSHRGEAQYVRCRSLLSAKTLTLQPDDLLAERRPKNAPAVNMNYRNYEGQIVEQYGVALLGWPLDHLPVCNPGGLSAADVATLLKALQDGRCRWARLTPEELEARKVSNKLRQEQGEKVYTARKQRESKKRRLEGAEEN